VRVTEAVVISAAGLGSRMGLGIPKAMIELQGKSLICRALDILDDYFQEIYVVGGYKAHQLWEELSRRSRPPILVINNRYLDTGTAGSVSKVLSLISLDRVLLIDGDVLFTRETIESILECKENALVVGPAVSDNPVFANLDAKIDQRAVSLSQEHKSSYEWSGISLIYNPNSIELGSKHLYPGLSKLLPIRAINSDWFEIDEPHDLILAEKWLNDRKGSHP
jgi:choline kinase